jgi:inorganic pyrophosphatase
MTYGQLRTLHDINSNLLQELEHFFVSYNEIRGKKFKLIGPRGPKHAMRLLRKSIKAYKHA